MSVPRPPARDLEAFALKKKVLRLETLYDVSRSLTSASDERALLEEILARAVPVLDAGRGFAAAFEDAAGAGAVASVGLERAPTPLDVASDPFVLDLARAKAPLARAGETVLGRPAGSVAGVPLVSGNRVLGVLVVLEREARGGDAASFDEEDRRFLGSLAALAAPALEGSRRFRALAADLDRLREENRSLKGTTAVDELLVGDSPAMRRAKELIARAAASRVNVLITGESGTGKELAARLLHTGSSRRDGAFLALNCAAMPEGLLESELFGIEKGVATGVDGRPGKFELASGGTVFLDEIGDTPLAIQAKLLRVLQEREIERVGGRARIPVDVRVLSATHQSLPDLIRQGRFREDLFYRLRVVEIAMPALRERREDIPRLAGHFLARIAARDGRRPPALTRDAVKALLDYEFPGNVRELENLLEGAAALVSGDAIEAADLQFGIARGAAGALADDAKAAGVSLRHVENAHISRVLAQVKGNKSRAAKLLGVSRRTLYRKRV
ncbi:MAG TPA: sigma 54-interacting transcriptional regulator [Thermoanaerobaculia bacterium]|nr:sigma 54-interacting transcriptional regulator [Thermoanaerobaculia bacterium]